MVQLLTQEVEVVESCQAGVALGKEEAPLEELLGIMILHLEEEVVLRVLMVMVETLIMVVEEVLLMEKPLVEVEVLYLEEEVVQ